MEHTVHFRLYNRFFFIFNNTKRPIEANNDLNKQNVYGLSPLAYAIFANKGMNPKLEAEKIVNKIPFVLFIITIFIKI